MTKGIDYAFSPHPSAAAIRAAGYGFAARYMSPIGANDTNGKNLISAELGQLHAEGLAVVVVEESTAGRMKSGRAAGVSDAQHGQAVTAALGMSGMPVYFACDFDATEADQVQINAYLEGAASVIGVARTGIYGGYYPVKRALDAGKAKWAWQTSAWSGGQWDSRAHIRQSGTVKVGGVTVDADEAMAADYGQWPRPSAAAPAPKPAPTAAPSGADLWPAGVTLKSGSTGSAVRALQYALRDCGIEGARGITVDGDFGSITAGAVRAVEKALNIPDSKLTSGDYDGIAGPAVRSSLISHGYMTSAGEGK